MTVAVADSSDRQGVLAKGFREVVVNDETLVLEQLEIGERRPSDWLPATGKAAD